MDKEQAKQFLRRVHKIPRIEISDEVTKAHLLTLFAMINPIEESNNQHSWTSTYCIGDTQYEVTYFSEDEVMISRRCTWEEIGL